MTVRETFNHLLDSTKQVFFDVKYNVNGAVENFRAVPDKEKVWVLLKTFCVAVACGLIIVAARFVLGMPLNFFAGFIVGGCVVAGGLYAFYRYAQSARSLEQLVQMAVTDVRNQGNRVFQTVRNVGGRTAEIINELNRSATAPIYRD